MRCLPTWRKPQTQRHDKQAQRVASPGKHHSPSTSPVLPRSLGLATPLQTEGNTLFVAGELKAAEEKYVAALELVGAALSVSALSARPDMGDLLTRAHSLHAACHLNLAAVAHKARVPAGVASPPGTRNDTAHVLEALTPPWLPFCCFGTRSVASMRPLPTFAGRRCVWSPAT